MMGRGFGALAPANAAFVYPSSVNHGDDIFLQLFIIPRSFIVCSRIMEIDIDGSLLLRTWVVSGTLRASIYTMSEMNEQTDVIQVRWYETPSIPGLNLVKWI